MVKSKDSKTRGQYWTPDYLVNNILDLSDYKGEKILKKHVIDNSCGDGAFLKQIVSRYILEYKNKFPDCDGIKNDLETYIHGIEIDDECCVRCKSNLNDIALKNGVDNINFDIKCDDALSCKVDNKMDYVFGNPPFVRKLNMGDNYDLSEFSLCQTGITDTYIAFYELSLSMLKKDGVLGIIIPSSVFSSMAASRLRQYLYDSKKLKQVVDLKHFAPFGCNTYVTIFIQDGNKHDSIDYFTYDNKLKSPVLEENLNINEIWKNNKFVFGLKKDLEQYDLITTNTNKAVSVKCGFSTNLDHFFIRDKFDFNEYLIPVVKSNTGDIKMCFFPYKDGKAVSLDELNDIKNISVELKNNEERLRNRSIKGKDEWYGFARSQGIVDVYKKKYAINNIIRNHNDIKITSCPPGTGVYGGIYILTDISYRKLKQCLNTEEFDSYIRILGKYKNSGYYTFTSKDLEQYLNYKLSEKNTKKLQD